MAVGATAFEFVSDRFGESFDGVAERATANAVDEKVGGEVDVVQEL